MRLASFQHRVSLQEGLPKGTPCFFGFQFIDIAKEAEANRGSKKKMDTRKSDDEEKSISLNPKKRANYNFN